MRQLLATLPPGQRLELEPSPRRENPKEQPVSQNNPYCDVIESHQLEGTVPTETGHLGIIVPEDACGSVRVWIQSGEMADTEQLTATLSDATFLKLAIWALGKLGRKVLPPSRGKAEDVE